MDTMVTGGRLNMIRYKTHYLDLGPNGYYSAVKILTLNDSPVTADEGKQGRRQYLVRSRKPPRPRVRTPSSRPTAKCWQCRQCMPYDLTDKFNRLSNCLES